MSTSIKEELHRYIDQADDRVLNMIYAMIHANMQEEEYQPSDAHKKIIDKRILDHQKDPSAGSSWNEVKLKIQNQL